VLPKALDEKLARIHAEALGAKITPLSEAQADYLDVALEGPFKAETYRY
jgi:adenosylhomocysteinase